MNTDQVPETIPDDLRTIELAFLAARERGEPLAPWLERYPEHRERLIDLAQLVDPTISDTEPTAEAVTAMAAILRRALDQALPPAAAPRLVERARGLGIAVPHLAQHLRLSADIVYKLDRGFIQAETVPRRLLNELAAALEWPVEQLAASLQRARPATQAAMYHARTAPQAAQTQSFAEALAQATTLGAEDRAHWLATVRDEGLSE